MSSTFINAHVPLYIIDSARIALNEYSAEAHTLLISVIDDDGLTYNHTIQFRGAWYTTRYVWVYCHAGSVFHADHVYIPPTDDCAHTVYDEVLLYIYKRLRKCF